MPKWIQVEKLSWGGQAEIWLVRDPFLELEAVQKKLRPTGGHLDPEAEVRRFMREVRCQGKLSQRCRGIMPIFGSNFQDNPPWYVMPRASETLGDLISRNAGGILADIACNILLAVTDAVAYAHWHGVYHRDLKPQNILLLDGRWVVGDFGLCRDLTKHSTTFTRSNTVLGSVAYMAPEQYDNGHAIGPQADVFALGRILYHMVTGRLPIPYQRLELVPRGLDGVVEVSTAEDPGDRYRTAAEFGDKLAEIRQATAPGGSSAHQGRSPRLGSGQKARIFELTRPYTLLELPPTAPKVELSTSSGGRPR